MLFGKWRVCESRKVGCCDSHLPQPWLLPDTDWASAAARHSHLWVGALVAQSWPLRLSRVGLPRMRCKR